MLMQVNSEVARRGYLETVFTEARTDAATVQIVDNLLDGSEIHGCEDSHLLRWRIAPEQISAAGRLGDSRDFVQYGKLTFFPAGIPYTTQKFNPGERNRNLLCRFEDETAEIMSELEGEWSSSLLERCLDINCGQIDATLQRLSFEMTRPGFASELLVESLVTSLAIDLTRYFRASVNDGSDGFGPLSNAHLKQITDYIISAREGCPTSAQLAAVCGMTPASFRWRFKDTTGQSLHAYVEQVRLGRAKSLLLNTDMMMKEIAYQLGFTHQATFTSSFRRLTGMSPSEYRQSQRH